LKKYSIKKIIKIVWFSAVAVFFIWMWSSFQSRNLPPNCFVSDSLITVTENKDEIVFTPGTKSSILEVIFFQGGLTDPKAYGPLCRGIAENGFNCHLVKMKWRLAQHDYLKITRMYHLNSGRFVIGGHSQGGKMAAQFVFDNPTIVKGLFLLGTSHPRDINLSTLSIPTLKLYSENDGLASMEEVLENKDKLPQRAKLFFIKGGNHSQFGYLGHLFLDGKAIISLEQQQAQTLTQIIAFLNSIKNGEWLP
jgi:hypothetical protein